MAKKQFLYENVYNDLKQKTECGDLKPGDKLAVEEDMIAHYGVSAITVKKALNLLAEEHRIRRIRGKGSFVMEYPEVGRIEEEEKAVLPEKSEIIQTGEPVLGVIFEHISSSYGLQIMYELEQLARKVDEVLGKAAGKDTGKRSLLSLEEVADLLGKSASTIYAMTSEKRIPYRKRGNRLYFFEDEIMQWIEQGGTSGTGSEEDFNKRLEALRSGKKRKPGSLRTDNKQEAL